MVPGGEAAQDLTFAVVVDLAGCVGDPPLELDEAFVAVGEDAIGDQDLAEMLDSVAGEVAIQSCVADGMVFVAEVFQDADGGGVLEPAQKACRIGGVQGFVEGFGAGTQVSVSVAEEGEELRSAGASCAETVVVQPLGLSAVRAGPERGRVSFVAGAA